MGRRPIWPDAETLAELRELPLETEADRAAMDAFVPHAESLIELDVSRPEVDRDGRIGTTAVSTVLAAYSHHQTARRKQMKKVFVGMVATAGLLGLIGGTVVAGAGTAITSPETITIDATVVKEKSVDVGKQGPSVGDTYAWTVDIKSQAGVDLGTERTQCTIGVGAWAICTAITDITGRGEIVATSAFVSFGSWSESVDFDTAITGGTGDFANVRGVGHVHLTENRLIETLELLP